AHPKVVAAIREQAEKLSHICAGVALYEPNVALAEALVKVAPSGLDTVFFGNSGAEAIEGAIKLARQVTRRSAVIVVRRGSSRRCSAAVARLRLTFGACASGVARPGAWVAAPKLGGSADIMALAKALGGGLPLGAVVAPRELQEHWLTGTHGSAFGGNPVSCA